MSKTWSGMTTREYKSFKGLKKENLRDNMTNTELVLNMLAEVAATDISIVRQPAGLKESAEVAVEGAQAAKVAREQIEKSTRKSAVSRLNAKNLKQMAELFQRDRSVITRHINNAISEGEFDKKSNVHFLHLAHSDKPVALHSLPAVIAVGYRVKSLRGTQFRRWVTGVLHEYLAKGFAMNDEFLKNMGGGQYWKELLERIRDIRASAELPFLGLTVFKGNRPVKSEVTVAKTT